MQVYQRTLKEVAITDAAAASDFFLAMLEVPSSRQTPLEVPFPTLSFFYLSLSVFSCLP